MAKLDPRISNLLSEVADSVRPLAKMDVVDWCERYRVLSPEASNEPGPWRLSRSPYVAEMLRACVDPATPEVVVMGASQTAKSEIILNLIAYRIIHDPAPSLLLTDIIDSAKTLSDDRLRPMFRDSPVLTPLVHMSKGPDAQSSTYKFQYPAGALHLVGSNSSSGVSMRPIKYLYIDEADRCSAETNSKEGDPIGLSRLRLSTYPGRKILMVSSPTTSGISRVEAAFLASTQEYYYLPCPPCGELQRLAWNRLEFKTAEMSCEACKVGAPQSAWLSGVGGWRSHAKESVAIRGFHISALLSQMLTWPELIAEWQEANRLAEEGDHSKLKVFVNGRFAEPWSVPSVQIAEHELLARREPYGAEVPVGVKRLIGAIDTQDASLEYLIAGIGDRNELWILNRGSIAGDLAKDFSAMYEEIDQVIFGRQWHTGDGKRLRVGIAAQDSAGHHSARVYAAAKVRRRQLLCYRGGPSTGVRELFRISHLTEHGKLRLLYAASDLGKDLLFSRLRNETLGPGFIHFPLPDQSHQGIDDAFFDEVTAEKKEVIWRNGQRVVSWKKKRNRERNEGLDLMVMLLILHEHLQSGGPIERCQPDYLSDDVPEIQASNATAKNGASEPAPVPPVSSPPPRRRARNVWGRRGITSW